MKSSKLIEIFKQGNMVIPLYLLQHYKDFKLKLDEFIFLMYLYNLGDNFVFDPSKFGNELNMTLIEVMSYIEVLTDKRFIRVESKKNDKGVMEEFIIMDDFYSKNKGTC
jgi:DNA replication protein DnaD